MSNNWEEFKKLFKSKQRLAEEEAQAVGDAVKAESSIIDKLKQLEEAYKATLKKDAPDLEGRFEEIKLDRVKYTPESDGQIRKRAEEKVNANYISKIGDINQKVFDEAVSLSQKKETAESKAKNSLKEIEELFSGLKQKAAEKSVRQGTARGSILDETLKDYENLKSVGETEALDAYKSAVGDIDFKLENLENERVSALSELDLKKAAELTETISALGKQRDKLENDIRLKNNAIEKQESALNAKQKKQKDDYLKKFEAEQREKEEKQDAYEKIYGYSGEKLKNYAERYTLALDFYLSLSPEVAPKALEASGNMKYYLGNYYGKLKDVLKERAAETSNKSGKRYL